MNFVFLSFAEELVTKLGESNLPNSIKSSQTLWAVGWDVPLIMHSFWFSFADSRAGKQSKSTSLHSRNLQFSHGISHGMIIRTFSSWISYFFLCRGTGYKTGWVQPSTFNKKHSDFVLWMWCSTHCVLLSFYFSRGTLWTDGWVSPLKLKMLGSSCVSCGMSCSSHRALFLLFLCSEKECKVGWVFFPNQRDSESSMGSAMGW